MRNYIARGNIVARIAIAFCLALLLSANSALAGELPRDFLEQYRPFAQRGLALYSQVTLQGSIVRNGGNDVLWRNFVYRRDGDLYRLDLTFQPSPYSQGFDDKSESKVFIANPQGSFRGDRDSANDPFVAWKGPNDYAKVRNEIYNRLTCATPYTFLEEPLIEKLQSPRVTIKSIAPISKDGRNLVEIKAVAQFTGENNYVFPVYETFLLSPEEGWAMREYSESDKTWETQWKERLVDGNGKRTWFTDWGNKPADTIAGNLRWTLAYEGVKDGVPLLKHVEYQEWRGGLHPTDLWLLNVENFSTEPSPASDFTPESVGIKEPILQSRD